MGNQRFKYISCYSLSKFTYAFAFMYKEFKYISCYSLSILPTSIVDRTLEFKYISCYSLSLLNHCAILKFDIQIHLMLFFIPRISAFSYITIPQASLYFNILSFFTSRICFPAKFFVSSSYSLYFRDSV